MSAGMWAPEPLVRARRRRAELAAEIDAIDERRAGAQRGLEELNAHRDRKQAELVDLDVQIKDMEKRV